MSKQHVGETAPTGICGNSRAEIAPWAWDEGAGGMEGAGSQPFGGDSALHANRGALQEDVSSLMANSAPNVVDLLGTLASSKAGAKYGVATVVPPLPCTRIGRGPKVIVV